MSVLRRLIDLGVTPETSATEARCVRLTNAIALLGILATTGSYLFLRVSFTEVAILALASITMFATLLLQWRRHPRAAGVVLCVFAIATTAGQTANLGLATGLQYYLLPLSFLPYFVFPRRLFGLALGLSCVGAAFFPVLLGLAPASAEVPIDARFYTYSVAMVAVLAPIIGGYARALALASESQIDRERAANARLLRDVLPTRLAEQLLAGRPCEVEIHTEAAIIYADIVGFTPLSESMAPEQVVGLLDELVTAFDRICVEHGVEKLKTLGDAFIAAAGIVDDSEGAAARAVAAASSFIAASHRIRDGRRVDLHLRVAVTSGTVAAGVVGKRRFGLDLWGEALLRAEELQHDGVPDAVVVDAATRARVVEEHRFIALEHGVYRLL